MPKPALPLPALLAATALASWGTIWHRSLLIARGACTAAEYRRMVAEKLAAAQRAAAAALAGEGAEAVLRPYLTRARANHRRLARRAK